MVYLTLASAKFLQKCVKSEISTLAFLLGLRVWCCSRLVLLLHVMFMEPNSAIRHTVCEQDHTEGLQLATAVRDRSLLI